MMTLPTYLDAAKQRLDVESDRELSRRLGLGDTQVFLYRNRGQIPSCEVMLELAKLVGIDPHVALLDRELWLAKSDDVRRAWERIAKRLGSAAATAAIAALFLGGSAGGSAASGADMIKSVYYGKWRRRLFDPRSPRAGGVPTLFRPTPTSATTSDPRGTSDPPATIGDRRDRADRTRAAREQALSLPALGAARVA